MSFKHFIMMIMMNNKPHTIVLTGIGHVGRQAMLGHMLMEKMNHQIDVVVYALDEVTIPIMQENPQDLFIFVDVRNTTELDQNRIVKERLIEISAPNLEDFVLLIEEQRKRRKDFVYIVDDSGSIENSLLHAKVIVETFFKIPAPVP